MERTIQTPVLDIGYVESGNAIRLPHHPSPRVSRRRARVRRGRAAAREGRTSRARAVPARLREDALSRREDAAHGRAGGDRAGSHRLRRRVEAAAICRRRLRLGRPRRERDGGAASRSRPCRGLRRRLLDSGRVLGAAPVAAAGRSRVLVSVVLQHRARTRSASRRIAARSASCSGSSGRRRGSSPTRRTRRRRRRSTIPTSSTASSTRIAIATSTRKAIRASTRSSAGSPTRPKIDVPAILLYGADDGLARPSAGRHRRPHGLHQARRPPDRPRRRTFPAAREARSACRSALFELLSRP